MQELTEKTMNMLRERDDVLANRIKDNLLAAGFVLDFENTYTILEAQINPSKAMKEAGPYAAFLLGDYKNQAIRKELDQVLLQLRRMIYEACYVKREKMTIVEAQYDKLFESLKGLDDWKRVSTRTGSRVNIRLDQRIVTTNYDMALELYFRIKRESIVDGFRDTADPYVKEFYPSNFRQNPDRRWLIKLHGSIWQFWFRDQIIKTIDDPDKSTLPIEREREMMIYPSKEKPILRNPYFMFYNVFKSELWNRLVVIGYSFRDDPVNTAILDNMMTNPRSRIIIVDPQADNLVENMPEDLQKLNKEGRFTLIRKSLEEGVIADLRQALESERDVADALFYNDFQTKYFY